MNSSSTSAAKSAVKSTAKVDAKESVNSLLKTIRIPPRPSLLVAVQKELNQDEPNAKELAKIIAQDVAMSASLLKLANSPFCGLRYQARSVEHAVELLGMQYCGLLLMGIIAKQSVTIKGMSLHKFWELSTQRAQAMSVLVRGLKMGSLDNAYTFGLFCDIGAPILMERFPDYVQTWEKACKQSEVSPTVIEDAHHQTNHASIGALMARTWGLPETVSTAILLQHDYAVLNDAATPEEVRNLIALSLLAEHAILKMNDDEGSPQWGIGKEVVCQYFGWTEHDVEDWCERVQVALNES
jgi:HD-like signal output (HDOD) protein